MKHVGQLWLVALALLAACSGKVPQEGTTVSGKLAEAAAAAPQATLIDKLPRSASIALVVRRGGLSWLEEFLASDPDMRKELTSHFERTLGVDVSSVIGVAAFAMVQSDPNVGALFFHLAHPGKLRGQPTAQHRGVPLFPLKFEGEWVMAAVDDGLWVGTVEGVKLGIDQRDASSEHPQLTGDGSDIDSLAYVSLWTLPGEEFQQATANFGLRDAIVSFDRTRKLTVRVRGSDGRMADAKMLLDTMLDAALMGAMASLAEEQQKDEVWGGAATIVMRHQLERFAREVRPVLEGHDLVSRIDLGGASGLMSLYGASAALAIPSFTSYVRKAKSSEARGNLATIAQLVSARDEALRAKAGKKKAKKAPPLRIARVPQGNPCSEKRAWSDADRAAFAELGFEPEGDTYYSYEVAPPDDFPDTQTVGAELVVRATGDLDCDGTLSVFELALRRTPDGALAADPEPVVREETE